MTNTDDLLEKVKAVTPSRWVWFYKPSWYWNGWAAFWPIWRGHDEFSRETLVLGWSFTGKIVIGLYYCGDADCYQQTLNWAAQAAEED